MGDMNIHILADSRENWAPLVSKPMAITPESPALMGQALRDGLQCTITCVMTRCNRARQERHIYAPLGLIVVNFITACSYL